MAGKPAAALAITDRAYERGADLGVVLQDLLELVHTVTRLKSVPGAARQRRSCRKPSAPAARRWPIGCRVPALARAWQMLLKGVGEVETAPDRRAAAEMVLIRLCHVADLPPPGDLVRRLTRAAPPPRRRPRRRRPSRRRRHGAVGRRRGGARAAATGAGRAAADQLPRRRRPGGRAARGDAARASVHSVHLVRFAPPVIELRPAAGGAARPGAEARPRC